MKKISKEAWNEFIDEIEQERKQIITQLDMLSSESNQKENLATIINSIKKLKDPRKEIYQPFYKAIRITRSENTNARNSVMNWFKLKRKF